MKALQKIVPKLTPLILDKLQADQPLMSAIKDFHLYDFSVTP